MDMQRIHATITVIFLSFWFIFPAQAQPMLAPGERIAFSDFGAAVALHENQALISAPHGNGNAGLVYAFRWNGSQWNQTDSLIGSNIENSSVFGAALALGNRFAVIGASNHNDSHGAAFIFERSNTAWLERVTLEPNDLQQFDNFGQAVALSDSVVLVGSTGSNNRNGAAYLYQWDGAQWNEGNKWTPSADTGQTDFGKAVAVHNGLALVGAPERDAGRGGVYVYRQTSDGWVEDTLLVPDDEVYARFGESLAIEDSVVVIGARSAVNDWGAVYVYRWNGSQWFQEAKLAADDGTDGMFFGGKVAIDQERILVGARGDRNFTGAVYLFQKANNQWTQTKWTTDNGMENDTFGSGVALSGDWALVGASGTDNRAGIAYIQNIATTSSVEISENVLPDQFELIGNYPNPFNPITQIVYQLDRPARITLTVFDVLGREWAVLLNDRPQTSGEYTVSFNASHLPGGYYIYRLSADGQHQARSMMLLK
jgi:hypothetical protein